MADHGKPTAEDIAKLWHYVASDLEEWREDAVDPVCLVRTGLVFFETVLRVQRETKLKRHFGA